MVYEIEFGGKSVKQTNFLLVGKQGHSIWETSPKPEPSIRENLLNSDPSVREKLLTKYSL
jgi:hypothetical protein